MDDSVRERAAIRRKQQVQAAGTDRNLDLSMGVMSFAVGVNQTGLGSFNHEAVIPQVEDVGTAK